MNTQNFILYLKSLNHRSAAWFDSQLLQPILSGHIAMCRLLIGFACVFFFSTWYGKVTLWTASDGPLPNSLAEYLIGTGIEGTGASYRVSPFFHVDWAYFDSAYLLLGTLMSLVLISGYGGRITPLLTLGLVLGLLHRFSMLQSHGEILLASIIPYLIIDNGWLGVPGRVGFADNQRRWTVGLATGLLRWHLMLWISISLCSHLSQAIWWDGTAVWVIAQHGHSPVLTTSMLADTTWPSAILGNLWLMLHLAFIVCLLVRRLRPLGIIVGLIFWLSAFTLSGDIMYAVAGLAATGCIFYESSIIVRESVRNT